MVFVGFLGPIADVAPSIFPSDEFRGRSSIAPLYRIAGRSPTPWPRMSDLVPVGYPACPNLEDQAKLWALIQPERIGVDLTEGFMMEPEASVSALVFHHPDAAYFSAGEQPEGTG